MKKLLILIFLIACTSIYSGNSFSNPENGADRLVRKFAGIRELLTQESEAQTKAFSKCINDCQEQQFEITLLIFYRTTNIASIDKHNLSDEHGLSLEDFHNYNKNPLEENILNNINKELSTQDNQNFIKKDESS